MPEFVEQPEEQEIGGFRLPIPAIARRVLVPGMPTVPGAAQPSPEAAPQPTAPAAPPVARTSDPREEQYKATLDRLMGATQQTDTMLQQRRQADTPTDRTDPKYRLGTGGRIMRALANVMSGGIPGTLNAAVNPMVPGYFGRGATNARYTMDEAMRRNKVANLDKEIDEQRKQEEALHKVFEAQTTAGWRQAQAERYEGLLDKPVAGSEYQDDQGQWWALTNRGQTVKLPGEPKAYSIASEKLRAAQEKPEPDPKTTFGAWYRAFKEENKRAPNAKEILNWEVEQKKATRAPAGDQGTWQLGVDENNRPVMYNTKTGDVKDAARGVHKAGAPKDIGKELQSTEDVKNDRLGQLERDFTRDWAKTADDTERDRLTAALNQNKARVQREYEEKRKLAYGRGAVPSAPAQAPAAAQPAPSQAVSGPSPKPAASAKDFGPAPAGKPEGSTGTLKDGTKVVVRKGRIVAQ